MIRRSLFLLREKRYPADPPPVEEVVAVMGVAGASACGLRTPALIVVLCAAPAGCLRRGHRPWHAPPFGVALREDGKWLEWPCRKVALPQPMNELLKPRDL